ncbi:MAG: hypothetical protein WB507_07365 [Solirubrobacterales bacterium]
MEIKPLLPALRFAFAAVAIFVLSPRALAQTGWNAVVYSRSGTIVPTPSYDLVDATRFPGSDICTMINNALTATSTNPNGVTVDARGVPSSAWTCAVINPWASISTSSNTVLLPAGTIMIQTTWTLPTATHLVGEGSSVTTIEASSGMTGDMIDMGTMTTCSSNIDCPSIVVEHLSLLGNSNVNGIVNCCSQEFSGVNDVSMTDLNIGLNISSKNAENSGPYTNITMTTVNTCLSIGTSGVLIANTRGVRGLRCSVTAMNGAAITIDSPNNSLEDISISGASNQDGILIGSQAAAQSNVLYNISGSGLKNVIHISGHSPSPPSGSSNCPNAPNYACDVTIMGVSHSSGNNSILDELTSSTIADAYVGMYVVGEVQTESVGGVQTGVGYTRMTTSTSVPTWLVGTSAPALTACKIGDLYSCTGTVCTANSTTATLWECVSASSPFWKDIQ